MKKRINVCFYLLLFIHLAVHAQTVSVLAGRTMIPGLYASLRYSHYTNSAINLAGGVFAENAFVNTLQYSAYGTDLMAEYSSSRDPLESAFACMAGIGATVQVEQEPWVYKDWPLKRRVNCGIVSEFSGIWNMTEAFALTAWLQQKFFFNKILGTTHFLFGLSLSYRLGL